LHSEALGLDYAAAVKRAEEILLPAFDAWRTGDTSTATIPAIAAVGTLDWMFAEYRSDRRYTKLDAKSRRNHEVGFKLVGGYILKDGKRLGEKRLTSIDTALTDDLYERLLVVQVTDSEGNTVERERRTTVNHAMKSCRRAWNVCARRNPGRLPPVNPFAKMGLRSSDRETPTAGSTYHGQGVAEVREEDHEADSCRHQEAARAANERRTFVRMSSRTLVRMKNGENLSA
jgi:hypothetical protein